MATRSSIGYVMTDKKVEHTYCHYDGYPEGIGFQLITHFDDDIKARELVEQSIYGIRIISSGIAEYYYTGEKMTYIDKNLKTVQNKNENWKLNEYLYIWDGLKWNCWDDDGCPVDLYKMKEYKELVISRTKMLESILCPPLS